MTKSAAKPTLSVAVSTADCASTVIANMHGLARQVAAIGGELIIVSGAPDNGGDPPHGARVQGRQ